MSRSEAAPPPLPRSNTASEAADRGDTRVAGTAWFAHSVPRCRPGESESDRPAQDRAARTPQTRQPQEGRQARPAGERRSTPTLDRSRHPRTRELKGAGRDASAPDRRRPEQDGRALGWRTRPLPVDGSREPTLEGATGSTRLKNPTRGRTLFGCDLLWPETENVQMDQRRMLPLKF